MFIHMDDPLSQSGKIWISIDNVVILGPGIEVNSNRRRKILGGGFGISAADSNRNFVMARVVERDETENETAIIDKRVDGDVMIWIEVDL